MEVNNFLTGPTLQVTNRELFGRQMRSCTLKKMHITILFFIRSSRGLLHYRKKNLSTAYSHMFSVNFRSETEKKYLVVG